MRAGAGALGFLQQVGLGASSLAMVLRGEPRLTILMYHRVLAAPDRMLAEVPWVGEFDLQMQILSRLLRPLPLRDAVARLKEGSLPKGAVCVTFDDGYADNFTVALPVLLRHGIPATFFVATAFLDGGVMWNDSVIETLKRVASPRLDLRAAGLGVWTLVTERDRKDSCGRIIGELKYLDPGERAKIATALPDLAGVKLPRDLMMTREQVRGLRAAGMEVGAHTVTHPILLNLDAPTAWREVRDGREQLEEIIGDRVVLFAYPNGKRGVDYAERHVEMVRKAGFEAAVSTRWGTARIGQDVYELPRFTPWDRTPLRFALRLIHNYLVR